MKTIRGTTLPLLVLLLLQSCDSQSAPVEKGRDAVKEVVTQPFNTLDNAKSSLNQSEDKQKAALEEAAKEFK
jgi:ABC-type transporter MlaC component